VNVDDRRSLRFTNAASLAAFFLLVAAAATFGSRFEPGEWYEHLVKAPWTPPNWVFAPVWTVLYISIALAGWLVWRADRRLSMALAWWAVQLLLNAAWSWLFFGAHLIGLALLDIVLLALVVGAFMVASAPVSRAATWLFAPYAAWILYATSLNFYAWTHNA
jgi:tryptophan-rich sensory protein